MLSEQYKGNAEITMALRLLVNHAKSIAPN